MPLLQRKKGSLQRRKITHGLDTSSNYRRNKLSLIPMGSKTIQKRLPSLPKTNLIFSRNHDERDERLSWASLLFRGKEQTEMKLIHYSSVEFELEIRKYNQNCVMWNAKPSGFWFSVEGISEEDQTWKSWCEGEKFNLEGLEVSYEIILKENANILHLKTHEEILDFGKEYPYVKPQWDNPKDRRICGTYELDWHKVKEKYLGIIIAPYQWSCRLHREVSWYYGWDCASGCIWDLTCIQELKLKETHECNRSNSCVG